MFTLGVRQITQELTNRQEPQFIKKAIDNICIILQMRVTWFLCNLCIPGLKEIERNEKTEILVMEGSKIFFIGPETVIGNTTSNIRGKIQERLNDRDLRRWTQIKGHRQSEAMITSTSHIDVPHKKGND